MKTTSFKSDGLTVLALMLALPTAWFILIAVLKYGFGIDGPFDSLAPTLESWGIKESLGWNINLLILFGPVLAFLLTIFQVLAVEFHLNKEEWRLHFTVQKKWFPLLVAAFSIGLLAILFIYMLGENCKC
jgi:hypothetical protein